MQGVDVAIVGAGAGGLGLAARLREEDSGPFAILERDEGIGGTWRANTYPGCACDIPSHLYSFSFAPSAQWTRRYPPRDEILRYFERLVDEWGLRPHLRLGTEVTDARFDPHERRWELATTNGHDLRARLLVTACGQLRIPHVPDFPGLDDFGGAHWHSARWNHDFDPAGKRVAVVGTGASAIQVVPELAGVAERLYVFQRSAPWVVPRHDRAYTRLERKLFAMSPALRKAYRAYIYSYREASFLAFQPGSLMARVYHHLSRRHLEDQVPDPELRAALTPNYPLGCKRVLITDDYYPVLLRPDVELVRDAIEEFIPEGVRTNDGTVRELDAVIFATGFDSQSLVAPMRVEGPDGRTLDDIWSRGPQAHLGMTVAGMPNLFLLYGPNTNLGHNSILFMMERQFDYILECVRELRRRGAASLEVRPEVMEGFNAELQDVLRDSIWSRGCSSWYKNDSGIITNNWPRSTFRYWQATRRPRFAEFSFA